MTPRKPKVRPLIPGLERMRRAERSRKLVAQMAACFRNACEPVDTLTERQMRKHILPIIEGLGR